MKLIVFFLCLLAEFFTLKGNGQTHSAGEARLIAERDAERNTVVLNNENAVLPIAALDGAQIASVNAGFAYSSIMDSILGKYQKIDSLNLPLSATLETVDSVTDRLKFCNYVIVQVTDESVSGRSVQRLVSSLVKKGKQVIVVFFGSGKRLASLDGVGVPVIWCSVITRDAASCAAQVIFGGIALSNKLNENYSGHFLKGGGAKIRKIRLKYTVPEDAGINSDNLKPIDGIVEEAIHARATPGAVVMVVRQGKVIFHKAYGKHTYGGTVITDPDGLFDMASVTKIGATTMAAMRLCETGKIDLEAPVSDYISEIKNMDDKKDIRIRELLLHQAGFVPFIPFYEKLQPGDCSKDSSEQYPVKVADGYYLRANYFKEVMWPQMLRSKIESRGKYVYSDLSMYFMKEVIEQVSAERLDEYVRKSFYIPLGMRTAGFLPRQRFARDRIVPTTENDTWFRKMLLQGYVHDPGAAMAGGVSGHAGLFAGSNDLAILFQMILNKGSYGGVRYFKPETVDRFTSRQSTVSRRSLGFDRWDPDISKGYPSKLASSEVFGHTGYTGTCVWIDPKYDLIYIFLSNRVYPENGDALLRLNIRSRIQDIIYAAIQQGT